MLFGDVEDVVLDVAFLGVGLEELAETLAGECSGDELGVEVLVDVQERAVGGGAHGVEDLLVALFGDDALLGVAAAGLLEPHLLEDVFEVAFLAPAVLESEGDGHGVAVVDLREGIGVERVLNVSADHAREAVEREHGALAGAAAGDDEVGGAGVQEGGGEDAVLHVGQGRGSFVRVHAVVVDLEALGLDHGPEGVEDHGVLAVLAVLVDQCDAHCRWFPFMRRVAPIPSFRPEARRAGVEKSVSE